MIARPLVLRIALLAALSSVVVLVAAGCGGGSGGSLGSGVVATVDGQEVTQAQLDEVIAQAESRLEAQGQKIPAAGSQEYQALQQNALQYLVQRIQYAQKADELGVKVSDAEVQQRLDRVIKQFFGGSKRKYEQALDKQGLSDEEVRDELRATLVSEKVFEKVGDTATVTDAEIEAYYQANPQLYNTPASRQVRHILVSSKALADRLYRQLENGADFAELARKHSKDSSKSIGGKLTIEKGQTVPEFDKVAFELDVNAISRPVKTQFGWHVIQALAPATKAKPTPLEDVKKTIRETLLGQKRTDTVTKWLEDVKREYEKKITYAPGFAPPPTDTTTTATS